MNIIHKITLLATMAAVTASQATAQEVYAEEEKAVAVQLHTNSLYWLTLSPNIGIEMQTNFGGALNIDYVGAWWNNDAQHRYFSNYAIQVEARYYLAAKKQLTPYTGHHVGVYGQMMTYDFEFGDTGYQSPSLEKTWAIGVAYGYVLPLSRCFSLDLTAGIGFLTSHYDVYRPGINGYVRTESKKLTFFGPTRLEATFVYHINAKNNKK